MESQGRRVIEINLGKSVDQFSIIAVLILTQFFFCNHFNRSFGYSRRTSVLARVIRTVMTKSAVHFNGREIHTRPCIFVGQRWGRSNNAICLFAIPKLYHATVAHSALLHRQSLNNKFNCFTYFDSLFIVVIFHDKASANSFPKQHNVYPTNTRDIPFAVTLRCFR